MVDVAASAYLSLIAPILGTIAGIVAGRWISPKELFLMTGLTSVAALALIVILAGVETGEAKQAFGLFIWLTGAVLSFLFAVITRSVGGRSLAARVSA